MMACEIAASRTRNSNAACSQKNSLAYGMGFMASMVKKVSSWPVGDMSKTSLTSQSIGSALLYTAIDMVTCLVFFETNFSRRIS